MFCSKSPTPQPPPLLGLRVLLGLSDSLTIRRLITVVLLDMDVKLNGEGMKLVLGQENIEHLIYYTKQQLPLY